MIRIEENSENIFDLNAFDKIFLIGTGKASNSMAQAIEEIFGDRMTKGSHHDKIRSSPPSQKD